MNPFLLVYTALYDMIAAREGFSDLVRTKNQIRFDDDKDRDPVKLEVATADLPELTLVPTGASDANLFATSSTSAITKEFSWMIATGDLRVHDVLNIEWLVWTGMTDWQTKVTELKWCDKPFVKRVGFLEITEGFTDPEQNRNIVGWSAVWACEVEMHFVTKDLKDGCP